MPASSCFSSTASFWIIFLSGFSLRISVRCKCPCTNIRTRMHHCPVSIWSSIDLSVRNRWKTGWNGLKIAWCCWYGALGCFRMALKGLCFGGVGRGRRGCPSGWCPTSRWLVSFGCFCSWSIRWPRLDTWRWAPGLEPVNVLTKSVVLLGN